MEKNESISGETAASGTSEPEVSTLQEVEISRDSVDDPLLANARPVEVEPEEEPEQPEQTPPTTESERAILDSTVPVPPPARGILSRVADGTWSSILKKG